MMRSPFGSVARPAFLVPLAFVLFDVRVAQADETAPETVAPESNAVTEARREFVQGTDLVKSERWAEALAAFERAAAHKSHPITTYNIAQCERAMGQYTRARRSLLGALAEHDAAGGRDLPASAVIEARGLLAEIERILSQVDVTLRPEDAAISVDGRPLEKQPNESVSMFIAGVLAPGPGSPPNASRFRIVMNPGTHVVTVARQGYQDVVVNRTFAPGGNTALDLQLDRLPATIHVTSNFSDAIVRVNGSDVGNPPVEVSRNAGRYHVTVARSGFVTYETDTTVRPGERAELAATLREDRPALTQRWWFWTAAGAVLLGAAGGTYLLTRSDPQPTRPQTDGGGLGWSLKVQ
jgi:hypothetical protein